MGSVLVVVVDVVDDDPLELRPVPDEGAVEEFASEGADPPLRECVRDGGPHWGLKDLDALGPEDLVERVGELASPSRTKALQPTSALLCRRNRLRAAWVVQAPVGLAVIPA